MNRVSSEEGSVRIGESAFSKLVSAVKGARAKKETIDANREPGSS